MQEDVRVVLKNQLLDNNRSNKRSPSVHTLKYGEAGCASGQFHVKQFTDLELISKTNSSETFA